MKKANRNSDDIFQHEMFIKKCMLKCSKKCTARAKLFFGSLDLLIFCRSRSCRRLALHFLIVSVNYQYINENFAFSPG